ncbi:hypothetical protein CORC01_06244, partial [Colletotrichum orchidophilum]
RAAWASLPSRPIYGNSPTFRATSSGGRTPKSNVELSTNYRREPSSQWGPKSKFPPRESGTWQQGLLEAADGWRGSITASRLATENYRRTLPCPERRALLTASLAPDADCQARASGPVAASSGAGTAPTWIYLRLRADSGPMFRWHIMLEQKQANRADRVIGHPTSPYGGLVPLLSVRATTAQISSNGVTVVLTWVYLKFVHKYQPVPSH